MQRDAISLMISVVSLIAVALRVDAMETGRFNHPHPSEKIGRARSPWQRRLLRSVALHVLRLLVGARAAFKHRQPKDRRGRSATGCLIPSATGARHRSKNYDRQGWSAVPLGVHGPQRARRFIDIHPPRTNPYF